MDKIDNVSNITLMPLTESAFLKPLKMKFTQNGRAREWHLLKIHDSSIRPEDLNDNIDTNKYPGKLGVTVELCAGIVDKDVSLEEIARIEVLEECGYDVPASSFKHIITFRSGIGTSGDKQTLFYVEVTDSMRISSGGGNPAEGECIEVVEMGVRETRDYVHSKDVLSPGGFLFAVMWFLQNKVDNVGV